MHAWNHEDIFCSFPRKLRTDFQTLQGHNIQCKKYNLFSYFEIWYIDFSKWILGFGHSKDGLLIWDRGITCYLNLYRYKLWLVRCLILCVGGRKREIPERWGVGAGSAENRKVCLKPIVLLRTKVLDERRFWLLYLNVKSDIIFQCFLYWNPMFNSAIPF